MGEDNKKNLGAGGEEGVEDYEKFFRETNALLAKEEAEIEALGTDENNPEYYSKKDAIEKYYSDKRNEIRKRIQDEMNQQ